MNTSTQSGTQGGLYRVMVMDDDDAVRDLVVLMLSRLGFVVEGYCQGEDLLAALDLRESPPCLMLLDINVARGMGGLDCLHALRQRGLDVPAIAMTGMLDADSHWEGSENFYAVLGKPFAMGQLEHLVRSVPGLGAIDD
jgi:DNA-binding NtrC family response regulator